MKILFLKCYLPHNFIFCKGCVFWCYNPFLLYIIKSMDDCDDLPNKFFDRLTYTENICVLFFSIWCHHSRNISIVD